MLVLSSWPVGQSGHGYVLLSSWPVGQSGYGASCFILAFFGSVGMGNYHAAASFGLPLAGACYNMPLLGGRTEVLALRCAASALLWAFAPVERWVLALGKGGPGYLAL